MKFQKLTIHNIASIEDAVIDFEAQPLAGSEVFLITGKTGAGKSTILDAICLALYADTPRLEGTKMEGDTKDGDKTLKIDDPRQLMRRNTGEAFVSLTFIGTTSVVAVICNSAFRVAFGWEPNYFYLYDYKGTPLKFLYRVFPSSTYGWFTINWFYALTLFAVFVAVFIALFYLGQLIIKKMSPKSNQTD